MSESARPFTFTAVTGEATRTVRVVRTGAGWEVRIDDAPPIEVDAARTGPASWSLLVAGRATEAHVLVRRDDYTVTIDGAVHRLQLLDDRAMRARGGAVGGGDREIRAVMPGKVVAILVEEGAVVEHGDGILVLEAMKMENEIQATRSGTVRTLAVRPGQTVESGELLAVIDD